MEPFAQKRKALFDCLDVASAELKGTSLDQTEISRDSSKMIKKGKKSGEVQLFYRNDGCISSDQDKDLKHLKGKESLFKKPALSINRCLRPKKTPDYEINPHRWTKYSLEDLDISENSNTSAALAFLNEMDRRKSITNSNDSDEEKNESASITSTEGKGLAKIEFKKSSQIKKKLKSLEENEEVDPDLDKPKFKGAKLIMPEYAVGQGSKNQKQTKPNSKNKERAAGSLKLAHLMENEDNED